jgi:hypothetical protein
MYLNYLLLILYINYIIYIIFKYIIKYKINININNI